jgi:hypothetical protein
LIRLAALVAASVAIAVAGCGDSRLDSGELHDQASAACAKASKELALLAQPAESNAIPGFLKAAAASTGQLSRVLSALKPPSDSQAAFGLAVRTVHDQYILFSTASSQVSTGGDPVVIMRSLAQQVPPIADKEKNAWQGLGIQACADR